MNKIPVTKVGVVVRLQNVDKPAQYLVVKPKGKHGSDAPYVLPRGTRMYLDPASGVMVDARDDATARLYAEFLEDTRVTATRELEEEAGVPRALFQSRNPVELGVRLYDSPSGKGSYLVLWYGVNVLHGDSAKFVSAIDSAEVRWVTLADYQRLVKQGRAREGYVDVLKSAETILL